MYLTTYVHHFEGKTLEESKPLLEKLWAHMTQDKYIMTVYWENNGDLVSTPSRYKHTIMNWTIAWLADL
jgi:alpha-ketoglutarate-dependent 2,4-dichlorophenoxyacetate dioxygenase